MFSNLRFWAAMLMALALGGVLSLWLAPERVVHNVVGYAVVIIVSVALVRWLLERLDVPLERRWDLMAVVTELRLAVERWAPGSLQGSRAGRMFWYMVVWLPVLLCVDVVMRGVGLVVDLLMGLR